MLQGVHKQIPKHFTETWFDGVVSTKQCITPESPASLDIDLYDI